MSPVPILISLANNKGDLGGVFKGLMSERAIRSLATSVLTASIIAGVDATFLSSDAVASTTDQATTITDHVSNVVNNLPSAITEGVVHGTISGAVDTAINGGDLGQNLLSGIQGAVVAEIGEVMATEIGVAYHNGDINQASRYIAHAALGGAMDLALGGDGTSGAVGAVVGEATGDLLLSMKKAAMTQALVEEFAQNILVDPRIVEQKKAQMILELQEFKTLGVNVAALTAGISAALIGKDVNLASMTGKNAAENNALCGGVCLAAAAAAIWSAYAAWQGDGDFAKGVRLIGAGEDVGSKLVESGMLAVGETAYAVAPEQTEWVVGQLSALGDKADAIVTFVDAETGHTVSKHWSSLSEEDRNMVKGLGKGASFVVGGATSGPLFKAVASRVGNAAKLEEAAEALGELRRVEALAAANEAGRAAVAKGGGELESAYWAWPFGRKGCEYIPWGVIYGVDNHRDNDAISSLGRFSERNRTLLD